MLVKYWGWGVGLTACPEFKVIFLQAEYQEIAYLQLHMTGGGVALYAPLPIYLYIYDSVTIFSPCRMHN